jgi:hypothetical protein
MHVTRLMGLLLTNHTCVIITVQAVNSSSGISRARWRTHAVRLFSAAIPVTDVSNGAVLAATPLLLRFMPIWPLLPLPLVLLSLLLIIPQHGVQRCTFRNLAEKLI